MNDPKKVPVVILAGGNGIFIDDSGVRKSKGEVRINEMSLIGHVIKMYLKCRFSEFIISGGYRLKEQIAAIKEAFDITKTDANMLVGIYKGHNFSIEFLDSGLQSPTGDRLLAVKSKLEESKIFAVTYSDSISTLNLEQVLQWHCKNQKIATSVAVRLPTRFRILGVRSGESLVRGFADKAFMNTHLINGGFYFFNNEIWSYFQDRNSPIVLETHILEALVSSKELESLTYSGAWQCLDSERDLKVLKLIAEKL